MASSSRPLDKALFAAGLQCSKRLYFDYHYPDGVPPPSAERIALQSVGQRLLELARQAFPRGEQCVADNAEALVQTQKLVAAGKPVPIFDAAFAVDQVEVRADVVIPHPEGGVDLFEVKSGTRVKGRYLNDVALQAWVIETSGVKLRSVTILHLNARYRHRGGTSYPVQALFKHADVSEKVRRQLDRVGERIAAFRRLVQQSKPPEAAVGTRCMTPFLCDYLPACRADAAKVPLLELPDLTAELERALREQKMPTLDAVDAKSGTLTIGQRRALRSIRSNKPIIEPFVPRELAELPRPLLFVAGVATVQVLPVLPEARPWHLVPLQWSAMVERSGQRRQVEFATDGKGDPREEFVRSLHTAAEGCATLVHYDLPIEQILREALDAAPSVKAEARALLSLPRFDFEHLLHAGVYHPEFHASFALEDTHAALIGAPRPEFEFADQATAGDALSRLLNSRTRAATRDKIAEQLTELGRWRCAAMLALFDHLAAASDST